jgi:FtsH-binding integral membrane protein
MNILRRFKSMGMETVVKTRAEVLVSDYVRSVYNWMGIGLALTGFVAYYVSTNESLLRLVFGNPLLLMVLIVAELGLVFAIAGMVNRMSAATATALFVIYSGLNGVTLSSIFLVYVQTSIVSTFLICAATFIACSLYGWMTKRDLTSLGGFMMMGLIGIVIASLVNLFLQSSSVSAIISYIGVFVFIGLTAYDTQKIKNMAMTQPANLDGAVIRKGAILGALSLYLDFINLFLMLLSIFGQRRD